MVTHIKISPRPSLPTNSRRLKREGNFTSLRQTEVRRDFIKLSDIGQLLNLLFSGSFIFKMELIILDSHKNLAALFQPAEKQLIRKPVPDPRLYYTRKRPCPVKRIISFRRKPVQDLF